MITHKLVSPNDWPCVFNEITRACGLDYLHVLSITSCVYTYIVVDRNYMCIHRFISLEWNIFLENSTSQKAGA